MLFLLFRRLLVCIVLCGLWGVLCAAGSANWKSALHSPHLTTRLPGHRTTTTGHVTILIVDMSYTMAQHDPDGLRCSAANTYIALSGPNDFIGVIVLDNNTYATGGPHNFQLSQIWQEPTEMSTERERQALQQVVLQMSKQCTQYGNTPTYDALNQALIMLNSTTRGGQTDGSVILLTDGVPCNGSVVETYVCIDTSQQINAIKTDLLPQFRKHNWPIDTVALGPDFGITATRMTFHTFLSGLSAATQGNFYDDGRGVVAGISPFNIIPFFSDIFAKRNQHMMKTEIGPLSLNDGLQKRNFTITNYTDSLAIVVVKENPSTQAILRWPPKGQVVSAGDGVMISSTDHSVIYSIPHPQPGAWELDVAGTGQFLMYSLKTSSLEIATPSINLKGEPPLAGAALPLGQPLLITTHLTANGQQMTDKSFALTGMITYDGALGACASPFIGDDATKTCDYSFTMDDIHTPGTYTGKLSIPTTAPVGFYDVFLQASAASQDAVFVNSHTTIFVQRFPLPYFLSPQTKQPTEATVSYSIIEWPWALQHLYQLPGLNWLSNISWLQLPTQSYEVDLLGQIQSEGMPYRDAKVTAHVQHDGVNDVDTVTNDTQGHFHVLFHPLKSGDYTVTFDTSGTFKDSHGYFGMTGRTVHIFMSPAQFCQEVWAGGVAAVVAVVYLSIIIFLVLFLFLPPRPFGEWVCVQDGSISERKEFRQRNLFLWLFRRNYITSQQAGMPKGLIIRFTRRGRIEVQPRGHNGKNWGDRKKVLLSQFEEKSELLYYPKGDDHAAPPTAKYYIISHAPKLKKE